MPTTSTKKSRFAISLGIVLLFYCWGAVARDLSICMVGGQQLKLELTANGLSAKLAVKGKTLAVGVEDALQQEFLLADDVISLSERVENEGLFATIIRVPSRRDRGAGYCGAGYEDSLVLMELRGLTLHLIDKALIQSCLTNISFASDEGDDPRLNVTPGSFPVIANFQSISPPDFKVNRLQARVAGRKIVIVDVDNLD